MTKTSFMALLKRYRLRANLTQEELAEESGVSIRAIRDIERGIARSPQRRTIESLAAPLALSGDELTQLRDAAKSNRAQQTATGVYATSVLGMLPPDLDDLTGRERDLGTLLALADELSGPRWSGHTAVLTGPPGAGKTSLAVRTAHELTDAFPDGRLFLKLRGMSSQPSDPADVLHLVLRSLGVDAVTIPAELEQRASLCRSLLKDRAAILVLDDAAGEAQVRPLLVGGPRCLTLITSRQLLVGLEGVSRLNLTVLDSGDAIALLTAIVGRARVAAEPEAARELAELCGRLPLALRIVGNRLASRPGWPLAGLVDQLRDTGTRLKTLTAGDLDVRSVFELSYRQLTPAAATVFRRLSLVPAAEFSAGAAMALADTRDAAPILEELADASLLQTSHVDGRYQFHDLLRVFAAELLAQEDTPEAIEAADHRLTGWLVRTATQAGRYFLPSGDSEPPAPTPWFSEPDGARRWLEVEVKNWLPAMKSTAARGEHRPVLDLAEAMHWYLDIDGTATTWHEVYELAVRSAVALGSKRDEAVHRNNLSWIVCTLGDGDGAAQLALQALDAAVAAGDLREQAWSKLYLRRAQADDSGELLDEAVRLFEEADYPIGLQWARAERATYWHEQGDHAAAAAEFERCLDHLKQRTGTPMDDYSYAYVLLDSATCLLALGSHDTAFTRCEQALGLFRRHGVTLGQARTLQAIAEILRHRGDHANAAAAQAEAHTLFERTGAARRS
ncbi:Helix-turn-helix domain-containing protein [Amycolatopsis xylanica]|uniref:Helix-turn-helix domain-containing protein n=1 Tax=Amycolatopsis xylanica TaxID=589385 RepID=A0A1H3CRP0_9PSEU|nr:helix-turn-helix domain-containing protein [Amycolatopsis xylanica]SDX56776.1 Helix-turn-helix domain-containing protein [Amycolatopsis xylanica]